ncbi:hypothetical protein SDC9_79375 [bioreactor metagenome]|uniref:Uncharacterized protein n=1 Tax=bioreactor metagenome TaxID=1076179 RepID=A0A644YWY1_9ZZZZ
MDIGEEGKGVVEVSELFVNQDSVGVRARVSKVPVDAYQQVLESSVRTDLGFRSVTIDRPDGSFAIGAEHPVVERCAVAGEPCYRPDPGRDALRRLRHRVEQRAIDKFLIAIAEQFGVTAATLQLGLKTPRERCPFLDCGCLLPRHELAGLVDRIAIEHEELIEPIAQIVEPVRLSHVPAWTHGPGDEGTDNVACLLSGLNIVQSDV